VNPEHFTRLEVMDDDIAAILRTKSSVERFRLANEANKTARARLAGHLKTAHPDWSETRIQAEVARRMLHGTA
jgi:hypothetical protein